MTDDKELIARLRASRAVWLDGRSIPTEDETEAADRIEALTKERDHWKDVAGREGVCMTCSGPYGAPEPHGCFDCFNTGYCGEHHNTVADLEAKLAKAVEALELIVVDSTWGLEHQTYMKCRKALAAIKGESHE